MTEHFYATFELANTTLYAGGNSNGFLAKINSNGDYEWAERNGLFMYSRNAFNYSRR